MKSSNPSPLEESLFDSKRDCELIIEDLRRAQLLPLGPDRVEKIKSALDRYNTVIADLTAQRDGLNQALADYEARDARLCFNIYFRECGVSANL
jgi:hypothetical protein